MKKFFLLSLALSMFLSFRFQPAPKASAKRALKILNGFCSYVPSGNAVIEGDTVSVQSFYMSSTEMTNIQYAEFLFDLKRNEKWEQLAIAGIDTAQWQKEFKYLEPYAKLYHKHPAYHDYPVVNVTKAGAELYCEWLTEKYVEISGGELSLTFRIPTHAEWMRAARGDAHYSVYTWGGPYLRNKQGMKLANFVGLGAENITRNNETGALEVIPTGYARFDNHDAALMAPSESYWPNDFGIYNMNGNVAEMVSDGDFVVGGSWNSPGYDIRNESKQPYDGGADIRIGFRVVATYLNPVKK